ncbi:MAG TPA: serine/threonine-protein kinase [Ktedonobacteraceae bacterium]|nr:serine/threonine-protein kinase [Ktedonobacteraceae bacterium]
MHTILSGRTVAIKILHTYLDSTEERNRFLQEARLLERMKHPHILHIFDVGIDNGIPYLVAEYAPNGSLRDLIKRYSPNVLPIETSLSILSQIGQALEYAHRQNIIHRDLKPENILFDIKGAALLADFGVATQLTTSSVKHVTVTGTPSYMAPEHFQGSVSKEGDQYSLACIAYELFTGHVPFTAPDFFAMGFQHLTEKAIAPTQLNSVLPVYIEAAVLKAMAKQREDRHADVRTFIAAMQNPYNSYDSSVPTHIQTQISAVQPTYVPTPPFSQEPVFHALEQASSTELYQYGRPQMFQQSDKQTPISSGQGPFTPLPNTPPLQYTEEDGRAYAFTRPASFTPAGYERYDSPFIQKPATPFPTQAAEAPLTYEVRPRNEIGQSFSSNGGSWNGGTAYPGRKRDSGRRWMIAAIICAIAAIAIVTSLLFAFLPSVLSPHTITQKIYISQNATATIASTAIVGTKKTPSATSTPVRPSATSVRTFSTPSRPTPTPTAAMPTPTPPMPTPTPTVATPSPTPPPIAETFRVNFTSATSNGLGVSTQNTYNGMVSITINGSGQASSTQWSDAFYIYTDTSGNNLPTPHTATCWVLFINGKTADASVGLPSYNSSHVYTVSMNLSQPATINFGVCDGNSSDNYGYYTITVQQQ